MADRAADHDLDALHRDPAARRGAATDHQQPSAPRGRRGLARVALHDDRARHDVLRDADAGVALDPHRRPLVHAGAVVAHVPGDLDLDRRAEPDRHRVRAARVGDPPARPVGRVEVVQALVQLAHRRHREVDGLLGGDGHRRRGGRFLRRAQYLRPLPGVHAPGLGLPDLGVLGAREHRDRAVLGRHRHPAVGLGEHRRLAGDRVAQHGEAVDRADGEGVEAVQVHEAGAERLLEVVSLLEPPGQVAGRDLRVVVGLELDPLAGAGPCAGGCGWRGSRCGRGRGRGRWRTGGSARWSRRSRSPFACARARGWPRRRRARNARRTRAGRPPPCRSRSARRCSSRAGRIGARRTSAARRPARRRRRRARARPAPRARPRRRTPRPARRRAPPRARRGPARTPRPCTTRPGPDRGREQRRRCRARDRRAATASSSGARRAAPRRRLTC